MSTLSLSAVLLIGYVIFAGPGNQQDAEEAAPRPGLSVLQKAATAAGSFAVICDLLFPRLIIEMGYRKHFDLWAIVTLVLCAAVFALIYDLTRPRGVSSEAATSRPKANLLRLAFVAFGTFALAATA